MNLNRWRHLASQCLRIRVLAAGLNLLERLQRRLMRFDSTPQHVPKVKVFSNKCLHGSHLCSVGSASFRGQVDILKLRQILQLI